MVSGMDRVTAVPGDLSRPLLGLDDMAFKASKCEGLQKKFQPFFALLGKDGHMCVLLCPDVRIEYAEFKC